DVERAREALAIWSAAREPQGTPAWKYLLRRGIALEALPSRINEVLRFHPDCPWRDERRMCLVALWTDTISGEARAIHRRPITPDGENLGHWRSCATQAAEHPRLWAKHSTSLRGRALGACHEPRLPRCHSIPKFAASLAIL